MNLSFFQNDYIIFIIICIIVYIIDVICECIRHYNVVYKNTQKDNQRKQLLLNAKLYLQPYDNLWNYQTLVNNNISVSILVKVIYLQNKEKKISIKTHNKKYADKVWDIILSNFNSKINYDELINIIKKNSEEFKYYILIEEINKKCANKKNKFDEYLKQEKILDVNNCSTYELAKLPGINIIMAKKIVIERDKNNGFKSKNEFFKFIKLKPHFEEQLKKIISVKKVKIKNQIKMSKERIIDL